MSGVDQKASGTAVKSVEERNIPWSQQVDEASYENLSSPAIDDNSGSVKLFNSSTSDSIHSNNFLAGTQSSMQFQFPPFYIKENNNSSSNITGKGRKTSHNNEKHGSTSSYNNPKRDDHHLNAWISRRPFAESPSPSIRINQNADGHSSKLDKRTSDPMNEIKTNAASVAPKKTTWASIASQPAKLTSKTTFTTSSHKKKGPGMPPPPMVPGKHNLDVNVWDLPNSNPPLVPSPPLPIDLACTEPFYTATTNDEPCPSQGKRTEKDDGHGLANKNNNLNNSKPSANNQPRQNWNAQQPPVVHQQESRQQSVASSVQPIRRVIPNTTPIRYNDRRGDRSNYAGPPRNDFDKNIKHDCRDENNVRVLNNTSTSTTEEVTPDPQLLLDELKDKNNYNPTEIDLEKAATARFFVIKSYSEDDIHRSIKYEIWCSTDHGNKRLDDAFKERYKEGGNILLFFSVNGSGYFCGMAQMMTSVDYNSISSVWSQDKWKGKFKVKWIYVKDVPNGLLRHIRLENNDNKSVTNSRDTQEIPNTKGIEVLQILHTYMHITSIFDDFSHYEKKQEEEVSSKRQTIHPGADIASQTQLSNNNRHYIRQNDDRDRDRDRDLRDRSSLNSMPPKNFFGGGNNFRERNSAVHKSGIGSGGNYHGEYRRGFDGPRAICNDRENLQSDRENHFGTRHSYNSRKDDHPHSNSTSKPRLNKRDFSTEQIKNDVRFRPGLSSSKDLPKQTNENERMRNNDYL